MPITPAQLRRMRKHAMKGGGAGWLVFNPSAGLRIGGVDYSAYLVRYSQSLKFAISPYAGTFSCQLDGPRSALAGITVEQELTYNRDGVLYAGIVRAVTPADQVTSSANVTLTIDAQDFTTLLDADVCSLAISAPRVSPVRNVIESDLQRIGWLVQSFGRRGLTLHHVQQNYSSVPAKDYSGMTLKAAIKDVLSFSGGSLYVDSARDLHCFIDEKQYAPFTLSETPDNVTSFPYSDLGIPADSIDLRNAVYAIPGSPPVGIDTVTEFCSTTAFINVACAAIAGFRRADSSTSPTLVSIGAFAASPAGPTVSPLFGQPTQAGNLLTCCLNIHGLNDVTCSDATWFKGPDGFPSNPYAAIFYKPNCNANETAPTFTSTGGSDLAAQLAEWTGAARVNPLDQFFAGIANSVTDHVSVSTSQADQAGDLVLAAFGWNLNANVTASFTATLNGNAANIVHLGSDGQLAQQKHASFWGGLGLGPTWYTDETSIALYGRREGSFSDTGITTQADLDAKAAAFLAANAYPRQQGSFKCRTAGLTVGQRFTIQSSLYTVPVNVDPLGNYSGVIQGIEVSYSEDEPGPLFAVEFMEPTVNLAVQLADVIASIPQPTATPIRIGDYRARAHAVGGQAIAGTTNTKIALATVDTDPAGCFDSTASRYTAKVAGTYDVQAAIQLTAQVGANYYIAVNGSLSAKPGIRFGNTASATTAGVAGGDQIYLGVGDYVELWIFTASAATVENSNELLKNATFLSISLLVAA